MRLPQTPDGRLDGKRALVTGASQGLGLAVSCALAQAGAHVSLVARGREKLEALVEALKSAGHAAEALPLDVNDSSAVKSALSGLRFDILVNNAGTNRPKPIADVSEEDYAAVMDLNVRATYFITQTVIELMPDGGSVINLSSQMGHVGAANRSLYCASKSAVEGMTRAMAVELGPRGIRVNSLCPTFIETPMTRPYFQEPGFLEGVLDKIPLGRLGQIEDVMGPAVFLASPASAMVTGSALMVDGGWTAH
ncbi:SDR family NAD(P)-dependent oxidoreductase [Halomonas chromatireducens]|uniref:Gluconate 5-dehydrogenase n=1 Tax=Halomonas chromatireducens TaxID=507626 RepID=A0A120JWS0_9GAMM|nr:glucose 1-dehydrogenase [Halomonas chromatireducens]AMD02421.1 Gluconate 5-dehydrogenase [Halomonas chromatireducens]